MEKKIPGTEEYAKFLRNYSTDEIADGGEAILENFLKVNDLSRDDLTNEELWEYRNEANAAVLTGGRTEPVKESPASPITPSFDNTDDWDLYDALGFESERRKTYEALISNDDPEISAAGEDLIDLEDSMHDARREALGDLKETDALVADAENAMKEAEDLLSAKNTKDLVESLEAPVKETLTSTLDARYKLSEAEISDIHRQAAAAVAEHPVRFMCSAMRDAIDEIKAAKELAKGAETELDHDISLVVDTVTSDSPSMLASIKTTVSGVLMDAAIGAAGVVNAAYEGLSRVCKGTGEVLRAGRDFLGRGGEIFLECATLGYYSVLQEKAGRAPAYHKDWSEVRDKTWVSERSPAQFVEEKTANAAAGIDQAVDNAKTAATTKVKEFFWDCEKKMDIASLKCQATCLSAFAYVAEKSAAVTKRSTDRARAKIEKLTEIDKKLFESEQEIKKAINSLTAITPYVKEPYVPNPTIVEQIEKLKSITQTPAIRYQIKIYENQLKKSKAAWERAQEKKAQINAEKIAGREEELAYLQEDLAEIERRLSENGQQLLDAGNKLAGCEAREKALTEKGNDALGRAVDKAREASRIEKTLSSVGKEKDDGPEIDD